MSVVKELKDKVLRGYLIDKSEALRLDAEAESGDFFDAANEIRAALCGRSMDLCSIINGKSGSCSENCKFCAQSKDCKNGAETYPLLDGVEIAAAAKYNFDRGVHRFSIVTAGRTLNQRETAEVCRSYKNIGAACGIFICASHGLLSFEQLKRLRGAGVKRYHCNLETSRRYFPNVCTTHTYDDKIKTIKNAQRAGLETCSGGIFGIGENAEDRIDMALELRALNIKSVPINILNPIPGTAFGDLPVTDKETAVRIVALYRFLLPDAAIRVAGGRGLFDDLGEAFFKAGANAAATGDMLTTKGVSIEKDRETAKRLGFEV
ncbi:MAG: biotin synthase BioB [Clostridiales bacterium]|jgi:biotin synthase|nr:biotin synthase BioB [Clostridiales bacterium]